MTSETDPSGASVMPFVGTGTPIRPSPRLLWYFFFQSFAGLVLMPLVFLPLLFRYLTLQYRFDATGIRASWGVLFHREIFVTYARIQDIHLSRGLLERWMRLGRLDVQTASGSTSAEISIQGLTELEPLRDFLYSKMRGRHAPVRAPWPCRRPARPVRSPPSGRSEALLAQIRDEVRALREALEEPRDG